MIPQESMRNEIVIELPKKTIETSHNGRIIQQDAYSDEITLSEDEFPREEIIVSPVNEYQSTKKETTEKKEAPNQFLKVYIFNVYSENTNRAVNVQKLK